MVMNNTLIIFDFFGVIGGELSPKWFKNHFEENLAVELKNKYFIPADNGIYTIEETINNMASDLGFKYDAILNELKLNVSINNELLDYILKLRKNNKVILLSNAAKGIFELFYPSINLNDYFDKVFISAYHNMQKPDLKFYLKAINSFSNKFDEIYMIDDNIKNISHLNEINVKGIQYKNNKELFEVLNKYL